MLLTQPKNLADLKRMVKPGVWIESTYHMKPAGRDPVTHELRYCDEPREAYPVHQVHSNSWTHIIAEGKPNAGRESWMYFQKASEWEFTPEAFIHYETDRDGARIKCLTYRFVEAPSGTQS